jgi:hypothetical protein
VLDDLDGVAVAGSDKSGSPQGRDGNRARPGVERSGGARIGQ